MRLYFTLLLIICLCIPARAQKKVLPALKAASRPAATYTPKQILEQTRLFIGQHGRRPRAQIPPKLPLTQLTPSQQAEVRLGRRINNLLTQAHTDPQSNTPTVQKLRALVKQFPNAPKAKTAALLLQETRAFIKEHGYLPQSYFFQNGYKIPYEELSSQQQIESRLGRAIFALLVKAKQFPQFNTPEVDELRRLRRQYTVKSRLQPIAIQRLPQLVQEVQAFIEQHARRPKEFFYQNGVKIPENELSIQQQEEAKLGRILAMTLTYANTHGLTQLEDVKTLRQLLEPYTYFKTPMPSVSEILQQTRKFIEINGRRPKTVFFTEQGERIAVKQLSPEEFSEYRLGTMISRTFTKFKQGEVENEKETVEQLQELVQAYPNSTPTISKYENPETWQEIINQLEEFVTTYQHRPREQIIKQATILATDELSEQERAEVQLGRKITQIFVKAKEIGQTEHPLIVRLRELTNQYPNKTPQSLPALAAQFEQFIQLHHRRPRTMIHQTKTIKFTKLNELSPSEQAEIRLGRQIYNLRRQAQQNPDLQQDPAVQKILQLFIDTAKK